MIELHNVETIADHYQYGWEQAEATLASPANAAWWASERLMFAWDSTDEELRIMRYAEECCPSPMDLGYRCLVNARKKTPMKMDRTK